MRVPSSEEVRERIENIRRIPIRYACMTAYIYCGRASEVVGRAYHSDRKMMTRKGPRGGTKPRGPRGTKDVRLDRFVQGGVEEPAVVFTVRTAKRKGMVRSVAIPVQYDPWAELLYKYFREAGDSLVFPFTRQFLYDKAKREFKGWEYPIDPYKIWENGDVIRNVAAHTKPFGVHALRHVRATELVEYYGFDGFNLAAYGGWTISTTQAQFGVNFPRVISRYLYLNWQGYFSKLLKKR